MNAPKTVSRPSPWPDLTYTHPNLRGGDIVQGEEAGTLWLWAWPELLDWPRQISWLFSPVVGKYPWPGDLWGVDESGEILVVENKSAPRPSSPFEDFLALERQVATTPCTSHTVEELHEKWSDALAGERAFLESHADTLKSGRGSLTEWRGLVPNSLKRLMVWRWRELYLVRIAPLVSDPTYAARTAAYLERARHNSWAPQYFGVFTLRKAGDARLSKPGERHYRELLTLVSPLRVHSRVLELTIARGTSNRRMDPEAGRLTTACSGRASRATEAMGWARGNAPVSSPEQGEVEIACWQPSPYASRWN